MDGLLTASGLEAAPEVTPVSPWCSPPTTIRLGSDEVHVWRADLTLSASRVESLEQTLSTDERERAQRFCFQTDREHFIVARASLRAILGCYLDVEPDELRFCYSPKGKPALSSESLGGDLRFNLSHSDGLALYAVTRGREIGVDIERVRPELADGKIAERFFSPREVAALRALHPHLQLQAFFNCWTRKEAYIKARGDGLSLPLDQFDVSVVPGEPAALLNTTHDLGESSRWLLRQLFPGADYVAALAVEGLDWRLQCWQW